MSILYGDSRTLTLNRIWESIYGIERIDRKIKISNLLRNGEKIYKILFISIKHACVCQIEMIVEQLWKDQIYQRDNIYKCSMVLKDI